MLRTLLRRSWLGLALTLVLVSAFVFFPRSSAGAASFTFKTFELGATPGTVCPNTSKTCTNGAAEPAIRGDNEGNFFASSENGLGGGTDAWRSDTPTRGQSYTTLPSPNAGSKSNNSGFAPGGGDTDLAVAPLKNSAGSYNVYVASLNLASVDVSTSTNEGNTWSLNPAAAKVPVDDREWIAADMVSKVCISYHDVSTSAIHVDCSLDAGTTFTQTSTAFDTTHAPIFIQNNMIGNLAIDPKNHNVYQTWSSVHDTSELPQCQSTGCNFHTVWMGVSTDGGKTFTDHIVYNNPNTKVSYGHQFVNVSIDNAGNLYSVFCDNHNIYYSFSKDHGTTWSSPVQVNSSPANTAIFPWSVANRAGRIDIVYYGTSFFKAGTVPDNYPKSATWFVYMAQNVNATTAGSRFTQVQATPIVHSGGACESGVTCSGNRDLFDDFGVAVDRFSGSSAFGFASIVYSDDQFINDANDPPASACTVATTNTSSCDHTSIATQTAGTAI